MDSRTWIVTYRVVFALAALFAIGYQFVDGRNTNADFRPGNFWSFFTIQSNLFAALVLLAAAWRMRDPRPSSWFDLVRGAAVVYLSTTGVVYGLLLSGYQEELQTTIPWVDTMLHRLIPLVMVADWLIDPPSRGIDRRAATIWLLYPLAYMVYSLVRGPIVDWYPYPFLDPGAAGSYGVVALYCVGIALGVGVFAAIVLKLSRRAEHAAPAM
ncbi:MAG: Pr6Pr family membrane protein [Chloroflexia bacterium]|nr:Pr6Pr family membrane protein [Chloroflexia bacterium]